MYWYYSTGLDLQPVDIKSRRRHNWKSARVVNSHLVCDPTIRQPGFDLPRQQWSLLNHFRTEQGHCGAAEGNGDLQTLICVLVVRPRRCLTLSNPAPWQNWMAAYLGYTLRMKTLFCGWLVMVHDTHTRRRRSTGNSPQLYYRYKGRSFYIAACFHHFSRFIRSACKYTDCKSIW